MPHCGSQVILCDLPVRFDTYRGCAHACRYCFAAAKRDLADVQPGESIVEGLKRKHVAPGTLKIAGDWCMPADVLAADFRRLRARGHDLRLRFYCAENRLRRLSDDRCCCGVDGLRGFRPNRANLNSFIFGAAVRYTTRMREPGTAGAVKGLCQDAASTPALASLSYADAMGPAAAVPAYRAALGLSPKPDRPVDTHRRQARRRQETTPRRSPPAHWRGPTADRPPRQQAPPPVTYSVTDHDKKGTGSLYATASLTARTPDNTAARAKFFCVLRNSAPHDPLWR